jgi:hypothetical protein
MSYYQIRSERRWLSQNDASLLEDLQNNYTMDELATKYNKPSMVIRSRILHLALTMINDVGLGIKAVSSITAIPESELQTYVDLIERKKTTLFSKL